VPIHNPYSAAAQLQEVIDNRKGRKTDKQENMISTENILFILGGSFERSHNNLESIVKKRLQHKGRVQDDGSVEILGFTPDTRNGRDQLQNYYKEAQADDFINFGLLPELIGRSPIKTFVNLLSKNDLTRIMLSTEDSILNQYKMEFRLFNIALEFTLDAVEYVAQISENRKTGARTLVSVWENILTDFQFELPGSNFSRIEVTRRLCEHPKDVLLEMMEKSPFVDFIENFKTEYGIELIMGEAVQQYVEEYAAQNKMQVSQALKTLLLSASALNYMGIRTPFEITLEMVQNKTYFDTLFTQWYQNQNKTDPVEEIP
ncbi:MAG: AAA family ATPase, partial [Proteobacteria bacterium]|nr:AAA family ATPase [Pseudomonadota bacterium]